jgi:murein DD-endopeptidase MepM/ murein hydrolase activator NlpD
MIPCVKQEENNMKSLKKRLLYGILLIGLAITCLAIALIASRAETDRFASRDGYIKWVDFDVTAAAMNDALKVDLDSYGSECHINWIDALSYLGAKYGGNFKGYKKSDLTRFCDRLQGGESIEAITDNMKFFSYYREAYGAVLEEYVGEFYRDGQFCYGLRAFSPIANGYYYEHYDDFGASRSYGYAREHLGHDLMGSIGTPIIAIESGYVEAIGWNPYGGWRVGIRSFDNQRYYYYAHLRKDHPYARELSEGDIVTAGDVIGYLGMTGYSAKENVNNINVPHLHFGIQLIFDASQKDGINQIWIDCYELTKFLYQNRMATSKTEDGKDRIPATHIVISDIPD